MKGKQKNRSPKMKKYLLIALLTSLSIQAEDNPFALKENLQKIDKDQDVLLSALKEMSDNQEAKEEVLDAQEANENVVTDPNTKEVSQIEEVSTEEDMSAVSTKSVDIVREKLMAQEAQKAVEQKQEVIKNDVDAKTEAKVQQKKEEERRQKIKEEQAKIEAQREQELAAKKEAQIQQEKARAQKEKERLEVEAYEKKRAAKKELEAKETNSPADEAIADINITREQILSKKEADKAYLEAVAEMDKED